MLLDLNGAIERAADRAIAASGEQVTVTLVSGGTIQCMAVPMYEGIKASTEAGGERTGNRLVLEIAKAQYPVVTVNGDRVRFPAKWARKGGETVEWRVAGFMGDQTAPGSWLLKMSA